MRTVVTLVLLASASLTPACADRNLKIEEVIKVTDVRTGWYDAGIVNQVQNKLVPSVSLKLQNVSQRPVSDVTINAIFRRVGEQEAWGEHFVNAIGSDGLGAGATGGDLVLRSNLGYTGGEGVSRLKMLAHGE